MPSPLTNVLTSHSVDYTIRIELHNANAGQYLDLVKKLAAIGVIDTIRAGHGVIYKMPQAEYNAVTTVDIHTIEQACSA